MAWRLVPFFLLAATAAGCVQFSEIPRSHSAIEQQLRVRALERSLADLNTAQLANQNVFLRVWTASENDGDFVQQLIRARFREKGLRIVEDENEAQQEVHVFAHVVGTDRGDTLIGLPSLPTPFVNVATPEIALFKRSANRGRSEVQLFVFDADSGRFERKTPIRVGESKYDNYTILLFVKFTLEDIQVSPQGERNGDEPAGE